MKLTARIPADVMEALRILAQQNDRSLNGGLVRALREYIERHLPKREKEHV